MAAILDYLAGFLEFFTSSIESIIWMIGVIPELISSYSATFAYAPDFLFPFLTTSVSLTVLLALIRLL